MSRKQPKRRAGNMVFTAIAGIFIAAAVGAVGLGVVSAGQPADAASVDAGHGASAVAGMAPAQQPAQVESEFGDFREKSALASTSVRTLDAGFRMLDDRERAAQEELERDNAAVFDRVKAQKAMQGVESSPVEPRNNDSAEAAAAVRSAEAPSAAGDGRTAADVPVKPESEGDGAEPAMEYDLPAVDWSVGREAFVDEWGKRIDAYLEGSNLAGYGTVFAEAAWENGVDPRWSPAISNTESGKGTVCFLPCNAWGWGASSWGDWETAIRDHVKGLAEVYGYSITYEAAGVYCPPNQDHWYRSTLSEMGTI